MNDLIYNIVVIHNIILHNKILQYNMKYNIYNII